MKKHKILILFTCFVVFCVFSYIGIYLYARMTPKLAIDGANGYYLYDGNNELYTGTASEDWINLDKISNKLIDATISIEDKNFYSHKGFDFLRIAKAMLINLQSGKKLQG
ncbi:MAG: monofunctional biosynthetic peptidoglycan transglycosylase, partial [Bacilli bacterium]|nr:monofunctional biosynthetic peptidoglycan transglycosylase [Bacilli bacterium]